MSTFEQENEWLGEGFGMATAEEWNEADRFASDLLGRPVQSSPLRAAAEEFWGFPDLSQLRGPDRGRFPGRRLLAPKGSEFIKTIWGKERPKNWYEREDKIAEQLIDGNFPDFLVRRWEPVIIKEAGLFARVWVMPDYLSIGDDKDWVYIPMSAPTAQRVADALGCVLPTAKLCHRIYRSASVQLPCHDLDYYKEKELRPTRKTARKDCGQESTCAYQQHSELLQQEFVSLGIKPGTFVAGHKKDVIIGTGYPCNKVGFQGFYCNGVPAEPCAEKGHKKWDPACKVPDIPTFAHLRWFSDYAQGVRLVRAKMRVDLDGANEWMKVEEVLAHDTYHTFLSPKKIIPARVPACS